MKSEFYVIKYILDTYIVKYKLPTHAFVRCIVVFKRNNNISKFFTKSDMSSSDSTPISTLLEFKQFCPRHSPHEILQSNPCFLQEQRRVSQFALQMQRILERCFSGAGGFFVFTGIILSLLINQPNFWFTDPYLSLIVYP